MGLFKRRKKIKIDVSDVQIQHVSAVAYARESIKNTPKNGWIEKGVLLIDFQDMQYDNQFTQLLNDFMITCTSSVCNIGFFCLHDLFSEEKITKEKVCNSLNTFLHNVNADMNQKGIPRNFAIGALNKEFKTETDPNSGASMNIFTAMLVLFDRNIYEEDKNDYNPRLDDDFKELVSITSITDATWNPSYDIILSFSRDVHAFKELKLKKFLEKRKDNKKDDTSSEI